MPYAPGISYHGDQYINQGFRSMADVINQGRAQQQQQRQFEQQQQLQYFGLDQRAQQEAAGLDLEKLKLDRRGSTNITRLPTGGSLIANEGTGQFQYLQEAKDKAAASPFGVVFDKDGNQIGETAMPLLDPQGNVVGNKAVVGGKETVIKPPNTGLLGEVAGMMRNGGAAQPAPGAPAAPAQPQAPAGAMSFKTADDVGRAYQSGQITLDAARKILRTQFGHQ